MKIYYTLIMALLSLFLSACENPNEEVLDYSTMSMILSSPTYGIEEIELYSKPLKKDPYCLDNWIGSNYLVYRRDLYCKDKTYTGKIKIFVGLKDQLFKVNHKYLLDSDYKHITITIYNNKTGAEIVFDDIIDGYIYLTKYETNNLGKVSGNFEIKYANDTSVTNGSLQDIQVNKL